MRYNQLMESTNISVRDLNLPPDFWRSQEVKLYDRNLDSLDGCPDEVLGEFLCMYNNLTSLAHAPKTVGGSFDCSNNLLTSLTGAPRIVGGDFDCTNNHLTSLADIHTHVQQIKRKLYIGGNPITSHLLGVLLVRECTKVSFEFGSIEVSPPLKQAIDILNRYLGRGRAGIMECQAEMLAAGLDDFAQI